MDHSRQTPGRTGQSLQGMVQMRHFQAGVDCIQLNYKELAKQKSREVVSVFDVHAAESL